MSYSTQTTEKLQQWAQKSGKSVEDLTQMFQGIMRQEQAKAPMTAPSTIEAKARSIMLVQLKGEVAGFKSPAIMFKGIVLGKSEPFDINARKYETAVNKYQADPNACQQAYQTAVTMKNQDQEVPQNVLANLYTNNEGLPIENVQTWKTGNKNNNFLNVMPEHSWIANIFAIGSPEGGKIMPIRMALTGDRAQVETPIGVPVQFRANPRKGNLDGVKAGTAKSYECNDSTTTQFELISDASIPSIWVAIEAPELADFKSMLADLKTYHDKTSSDYNRVVIVKGAVTQANPDSIGTRGNYRFAIDDDSLGFENRGITVWLPAHLGKYYNFAEGSEVIVIGQTQEGAAYDYEKRAPDPTKKEITINAIGLLVNPELRVAREEQPHTAPNSTQVTM